MKKLYFVTGNKNKLDEVKRILSGSDFEVVQVKLDVQEIQGSSIDVAKAKAKAASDILKKTVVVDDSSAEFFAWKGLPGPYVRYFEDAIGEKGLYMMLKPFKDKRAYAAARVGYCEYGKKPMVFEGKVLGKIVAPRGKSKFGFDPIFVPNGYKKTYAQMSPEEKNMISHRMIAFMKLKKFLMKHL